MPTDHFELLNAIVLPILLPTFNRMKTVLPEEEKSTWIFYDEYGFRHIVKYFG